MITIYREMCCGQTCPYGIDTLPSFSWKLKSDTNNTIQEQYQIIVRDENRKIVWDSGRVSSENVHDIPYEGSTLDSLKEYSWTVEVTDNHGERARCTEQKFTTGILDPALWKAKWIEPDIARKPCTDETNPMKFMAGNLECEDPASVLNPCVYLQKKITLAKPVRRVTAMATAHGIYELCLNGARCGQPLAPGYTAYREYLEYQCYDITDLMQEGANMIGAVLADGWYLGKMGLPGIGNQYGETAAFFMQVNVIYEDGSEEVFVTDDSWRCTTGAYLYADLFIGEGYDASKEPTGWMNEDFDEGLWHTVTEKPYGYDMLKGRRDEPAGFRRVMKPARVFETPAHEIVVDVGENVAGYISVRGRLNKGERVRLEYSEALDREGNFLKNIIGQNKNQTDEYIAGKNGEFYYKPTFTYHGFQYVRIEGMKDVRCDDIEVYVLGSLMQRTGMFSCSDERINQLQSNIYRSQEANMLYVPTDCPQREKAGWTGDMQIYSSTAMYLMDIEAFLRKWLENMRIEQASDGQVPHLVPVLPSSSIVMPAEEICSAGWADACVIIPYRMYQTYGDVTILRENYDMMKKWMRYVENKAASEMPEDAPEETKQCQKYLWNTGFHFGDWLIPSLSRDGVSNPFEGAMRTKEMTAPAMFAYTSKLMAQIAEILGDLESAAHYRELNAKIKEAYSRVYCDGSGRLKADFQGVYVLALAMDLVPDDMRETYLNRLTDLIRENQGCLDTGFVSMPFLLDTLYENGRQQEAWDLVFNDKCPSWLYEVKMGANTIWESWTNIAEDGTKNSSSYNHFAFGCVGDFLYRHMLGLSCQAPGFRKIRIAPDLDCGLTWAKGSYESCFGNIEISWSRCDQKAVLDAVIPPCTEAEIVFGDVRQTAASGTYHFETVL